MPRAWDGEVLTWARESGCNAPVPAAAAAVAMVNDADSDADA